MQKKVFLQRNLRKGGGGGPSYIRYLVISAICLVLLVLIVPYLFRGKNKEVTKRPVPDRGAITKEVPRTPEPSGPANLTEQVKPEPAVAPETVKTPEVQSVPKPPELPPATPQQSAGPEPPPAGSASAPENAPPAPAPAQTAKPAELAPKDLFPKKSAPFEAPPAAARKAPPAAVHNAPGMPVSKAAGQPPAAKAAPSKVKGDYAVRVGATYKNKSEAETVRKDLARKGYSAIVRAAPDGYSVITNPTPERKAYTLQEQMRIQGVSNTSVIKATPVSGPVKKIPTGKPANGKNGISPDPGREIP